jgi:hypothetical protein
VATAGEWGTYDREYAYTATGNIYTRALSSTAAISYTYEVTGSAGVQPHAVRMVAGGGSKTEATVSAKARSSVRASSHA